MQQPQTLVQQQFQQAIACHRQGKLADAERLYERVLSQVPGHFDALHLLGVVALQTGRPDRAADLIGEAVSMKPDAAAFSNLGMARQALGQFNEALLVYGQAIALKPDFAEAHVNRGNVLMRLNRLEDAVASFDRAIALKPGAGEIHSNRGNALRKLGRLDEAIAGYDRAIAINPDFVDAHNNRGVALADLKRHAEAIASFNRALAPNPGYADAHRNRAYALHAWKRLDEGLASIDRAIALASDSAESFNIRGNILEDLGRCEEALASYERTILLKPDYAEAHYNRGVVLRALRRFDEAVAAYDAAIGLVPDYADALWNKGLILLAAGRFAEGWPLYEARKKKEDPVARWSYPQPSWTGAEDLAGKTVFLRWEQGFGDVIQFCRYAGMVAARGARVTMSVPDPLTRLLTRLDPRIEIMGGDRKPLAFDYYCALVSLPLAFGTTLETIPSAPAYLTADPKLKAHWAGRLSSADSRTTSKPRIGLAWSGRTTHPNDRNRSLELSRLEPLLEFDAEWICLQNELRDADAASLERLGRVAYFGKELKDFADTAALIEQLDLVISIDTSVAHLAGALGKPVWILLPYIADWRWLNDRSDSPWYPSARLFRQPGIGDWPSVIGQARDELVQRFAENVSTDRLRRAIPPNGLSFKTIDARHSSVAG